MKNITKIITLFVVICTIFGIFTACGGLAASSDTDDQTTKKTEIKEPPTPPALEAITGIPGYPAPSEPDEPDEPERIVRYAASNESDKYHRLSCHYVDRIKSYNIVYYYTEDEARDDGKKPCSVCSP